MASGSAAAPADALDRYALAEMFKDFKDNRRIPNEIIEFIRTKLTTNDPCQIDEFLRIIANHESAIIRFYKKHAKLRHGFVRTDLLNEDARNRSSAVSKLRDFLLWNQGIALQGESAYASRMSTNPYQVRPDGKIYLAPISSGPLAKSTSNRNGTSAVSFTPAPVPRTAPASGETISVPALSLVTIKPNKLWHNTTLPVPDASQHNEFGTNSATPLSVAEPINFSAGSAELDENPSKKPRLFESQVIDLLLEEDPGLSSHFISQGLWETVSNSPCTSPHPVSSSGESAMMPQAAMRQNAPTSVASHNQSPYPANQAPQLNPSQHLHPQGHQSKKSRHKPKQSQVPSYNPLPAQSSATQAAAAAPNSQLAPSPQAAQMDDLARRLAHQYQVDVAFCKSTLEKYRHDFQSVKMVIAQYRVDLDEARLMDQARLASESTAVQDKQRAAFTRAQMLTSRVALQEFVDSELMARSRSVHRIVATDEKNLLSPTQKEARRLIVEYLDEEKKALKWYKNATRAYMRALARRIPENNDIALKDFFQAEVSELKRILYAQASESGTPHAFLAALDAESANVQPGEVLGFTPEKAIELG